MALRRQALLGAELAGPAAAAGRGVTSASSRPRSRTCTRRCSTPPATRNLWVIGGGNVASQFADEGLLDELLLTVVPVVLGEGKPLFDRPPPGGAMKLVGTRTFKSGMVELSYQLGR